jgi:hypothetical protein
LRGDDQLTRLRLALGDTPGSGVLLGPAGTARMHEQHLEAAFAPGKTLAYLAASGTAA